MKVKVLIVLALILRAALILSYSQSDADFKALATRGAIAEVSVTAKIPIAESDIVYVEATLIAKKEKADALEAELLKNAVLARREVGCTFYEVHRDIENGNVFVLYEKWKSKEALDQHFNMPYMKEWALKRDSLLDKGERHILKRLSN